MRKVLQFLREVRAEFGHITWPTKDTLIQLTFVVISLSIIISLILGGFDYLFTNSFTLLTQLKTVKPTPTQEEAAPPAIASPTIQITPIPTKIKNK